MSIESLKEDFFACWLYQTQAYMRNWSLGTAPQWRIQPHAQLISDIAVNVGLKNIDASVKKVGHNTFVAPSAWHAVLYCQMLQHHIAAKGSRLLFRGHRNSEWKLTPTIYRGDVNSEQEKRRLALFGHLLSALSFNTSMLLNPIIHGGVYLRIAPSSYAAAAQHYGIKTNLLDFTTDPAVAVKFATSASGSKTETASIFMLFLEAAKDAGLRIILPPPFAKRLYVQRGVFVEVDGTLDKERLRIIELQFPHSADRGHENYKMADFQVLRDNGQPVDIMPPEEELSSIVTLVDEILAERASGLTLDLSAEEAQKYVRRVQPVIVAHASDPLKLWASYVDNFEDVLYAIAYDVTDSDDLGLGMDRLSLIVRSNVEVACSVAGLYRSIPVLFPGAYSQEKSNFMAQIADNIDSIAQSVGYDYKTEAANYARAKFG
ncbi:MAG: FRG domain-containing protein [Rhodomicrobium sp.]